MKKVNILLGILYVNTLFLVYIFKEFAPIIIDFISTFILQIGSIAPKSNNSINIFDKLLPVFFAIWFFVYIIFSIINIVSLIIDYKNNNKELLLKKTKRIKLGLIPFWIINFICYLPISIILLLVGHGFGFIIVPIFIFASYTVLILTSIFSIIYLKNLHKNNIIEFKQFLIHSILQLIFVIDIIDIIVIIKKWGKSNVA